MKYQKELFTTKSGIPIRFYFEWYIRDVGCPCYNNKCNCSPRGQESCFAFCITYKKDKPFGGYKFIRNYIGIII